MTNDTIIKALECCEIRKQNVGASCASCPFYKIENCQSHLITYTLYAIKQQEKEIANLRAINKQTKNVIKEFAEKLHTKMTKCGYSGTEKLVMCPEKEIDNLVKEMFGEEIEK